MTRRQRWGLLFLVALAVFTVMNLVLLLQGTGLRHIAAWQAELLVCQVLILAGIGAQLLPRSGRR